MAKEKVRTRIAPSPTGPLHVGTARSALFNELFARQNNGQFIVRIEDTDKERSKKKYEKDILEGLAWLGLEWDEGPVREGKFGPYRQSKRTSLYKEALERLLAENKAYQVEDGKAIKLKVEAQEVTFNDLIRGEVVAHTDSWGGDFVIARSLTDPLYHLAVVVDDAAMEISHVIRGEDHLSNTPRHILLQRALGLEEPVYAHLPLLLDEKRRKLSKREHETGLLEYQDRGFTPGVMLNYLALLGWNSNTDKEDYSHEELIKEFDIADVQKSGAIFNPIKLDSLNKPGIQNMSDEELLEWGSRYFFELDPDRTKKFKQVDGGRLLAALKTEQGRISSYYDLDKILNWCRPDWVSKYKTDLSWKDNDVETTAALLKQLVDYIQSYEGEFVEKYLSESILQWIDKKGLGRGDVLWPMRVALTDLPASPGPFEVAEVLGKEEVLSRIQKAIKFLEKDISGK